MRCIFFTEQPYTDQGRPLDPLCYVSLSGTGNLYPNSAQAEFVGFGLGLLVRQGFLDAKAGHPARGAHTVFTFSFKVI